MAYEPGGLRLINGDIPGFSSYRYDGLDATADVDTVGFFNNDDDDLNLAVGDLIYVIDWTTAVGAGGTIADVTLHIVMAIGAVTAGAVNLSDDLLGATLVSGD